MTLTIRVKLKPEDINRVLFYFNNHSEDELKIIGQVPKLATGSVSNRPLEAASMQLVDANTSNQSFIGFGIETKIGKRKEIRWCGNILVNYFNTIGFTAEEEKLLYEGFCYSIGSKNVHYYPALSTALENSPTVLYSLTHCYKTVKPL